MRSECFKLLKKIQVAAVFVVAFAAIFVCGTQAEADTVSSFRAANDVSGSSFGVKLSWASDPTVNAYEIVRSDSQNGTYTSIAFLPGGETNTYLDNKAEDKHTYFYKIRKYRIVEWTDVYEEFSSPISIKTSATLPTPKVKMKKKKKEVTITFKSAVGDSYETEFRSKGGKQWKATSFKGKYAKSVTRKLNTTSKFDLRVRTKKKIKINGKTKTIKSGWSKAYTIK